MKVRQDKILGSNAKMTYNMDTSTKRHANAKDNNDEKK